MRSKLEMKRPVLAEMSVEVPVEEVHAAVNKAFATLSRKAKIRGFRQGKAPRAVLKRMFGDAILNEVRGDIINEALLAAFTEHDLVPLSQPDLDAPEVSEEAAYTFKATFEVRPKLESVNYDGVVLERAVVKVEEAEVEDELHRIRSSMAVMNELSTPRPAATGDSAIVSIHRAKDDGWDENGLNDQQIVIGEGHAPEAIDTAIVGMNIGDEKVVDMDADSDAEGKKPRYLIKLTGLKERKLPDLDDELAKDTGEYDTLDALKADIRKRIAQAKDRNEDRRLRNAMYDALRAINPMELPPSLVSRQAQALKTQLYQGVLEQLGRTDNEETRETLSKLEESAVTTAEEMVHQQLLMAEIARISDIKVDDGDLDAEIEKRAIASGLPAPMLHAEMNKDNRRDELMVQILDTKIFDFVKTLVTIVEVEGEVKKVSEKKPPLKETATIDNPADAAEEKQPAAKPATKKVAAKKVEAPTVEGMDEGAKKTAAKKTSAKTAASVDADDKKKISKKAVAKKAPAEK